MWAESGVKLTGRWLAQVPYIPLSAPLFGPLFGPLVEKVGAVSFAARMTPDPRLASGVRARGALASALRPEPVAHGWG